MTEATVANLALGLRVLLVGGFLLILPRITRKGLLLGAYVGEALVDRNAFRRLLSNWYLGCVILMLLSISVGLGISVAGWPVAGSLIGTAFLLVGALGLYLRLYYKARALAPPVAAQQAVKATAPLIGGEPKGTGLAKLALGVCIPTSVAVFLYAMVGFRGPLSDESFLTVMFVPSLNLLLTPFVALFALLTANAKRSVRGGSGGRSIEAQNAFRADYTRLLSLTALLACAAMTFLSVQVIRILSTDVSILSIGVWLPPAAALVFILGSLIWLVRRYGQGGALMERGTVDVPLTNGLADNSKWVWGLFFVDKDDPSIMVEKRFGIGHTLNYGNRAAILIVTTFVVLSFSMIALAVISTML